MTQKTLVGKRALKSSALPAPAPARPPRPRSPPALLPGRRGRLGDVDGLLQGALQVDRPLLYHLPDVLDPVLLVLYAGGLWGRGCVRTRGPPTCPTT